MKTMNIFLLYALTLMGWFVPVVGTSADNLTGAVKGSNYYKVHPLFNPHPTAKRNYTISRFGPVGIGVDIIAPNFGMKVRSVEKGSPAMGKLKAGQIIESINGKVLKDIDPRMWLGRMIAEVEASDGKMRFKVSEGGVRKDVLVTIPVLGAYAKGWPLKCKKSDAIVRNLADYLAKKGNHAGPNRKGLGLLFMLSTGEEKDLEVARGWVKELVEKYKNVKKITSNSYYTWNVGYGGPALCEYYLRTGDESVMHLIELLTDYAKRSMYNGGWSHRGVTLTFPYMGGAHLNAAGVHVVTFLLLAKECGADVDEYTLQTTLKQFYRYAGRGNTPYGDGLPEMSFVDNGKTGALAFTMAAAASLTPEGEKSIYAKARDVSAVKSFYSTSWLNHGHTGGGIGEIWRGASMGLMAEKKPTKHREFMDNRQWFYDISRNFDGSFGIVGGGGRYDNAVWGTGMALSYTVPRKTLRMTGAAKTKFSKSYQLPRRPWGNGADEEFYSLDPIAGTGLTRGKLDAEQLARHSSWPAYRVLMNPKISDEKLLEYAHHQDHGIRRYAVDAIYKFKRDALIVKLLKSKDARGRQAGAMAIYGVFKRRPMRGGRLTSEMVELLTGMIHDPKESWWVVYNAIMCLNACDGKVIESHIDRLVYWLEHDEWWLSMAAMTVLNKVVTDPKYYKRLLPIYGRKLLNNRRAVPFGSVRGLTSQLKSAQPEVQQLGAKVLGKVYAQFPARYTARGGVDMYTAADFFQRSLYGALSSAPGGLEYLKSVPMRTSKWQSSGKKEDLYVYDGKPKDVKKLFGKWVVSGYLKEPSGFTSVADLKPGRPVFKQLDLRPGGKTGIDTLFWKGKLLLDLSRNQALNMRGVVLKGEVFLLVEGGGFTSGKAKNWHPGWFVYKRAK